jgi:hypothetical protein
MFTCHQHAPQGGISLEAVNQNKKKQVSKQQQRRRNLEISRTRDTPRIERNDDQVELSGAWVN